MFGKKKITFEYVENGYIVRIETSSSFGKGDYTFIASQEQAQEILRMFLTGASVYDIGEYLNPNDT